MNMERSIQITDLLLEDANPNDGIIVKYLGGGYRSTFQMAYYCLKRSAYICHPSFKANRVFKEYGDGFKQLNSERFWYLDKKEYEQKNPGWSNLGKAIVTRDSDKRIWNLPGSFHNVMQAVAVATSTPETANYDRFCLGHLCKVTLYKPDRNIRKNSFYIHSTYEFDAR